MSKAENFSVVGKRVQRVEGFDKVTGESKFIADIQLPGALIGKVLRSPYPHARIRHIDTSKAAKLAGVRAVVTAEDTIKRPWGAFFADQYILSVGKARYVGEEVAAVAAIDPDIAEEAIDLIEVDWEPLAGVFDAEEAMADGAPLVHDDKPNNIAMTMDIERGNIAQAFAESDVIVEDTFTSMPQWHCSIETIGSVAEYGANGKYTIYMNTQTLFNARYRIATALGVPESDVRIIQSAVGGGFGGKSCDDNNALVAEVLAKKAGRPVKLINTREEECLAGSRPRVIMKINVKLGLKKDWRIRAKHIKDIADNCAYSAKAPAITGVAAMRHDTCYKYTDVKTEALLVYTNKIPTGAFRGFGNPSAEWAVEQAIDLGAHKLGIDPIEIARINAAETGYVSPHGNRVTSCELKQCLDMAEKMIDWKAKRDNKQPNTGLGLACTVHVSGKRLGILGMGRIGRAVAQRGRGFDMEIHYHNRSRLSPDLEQGATYHANPEDLLAVSEFLALNAPATPETHKFLNARRIAMLPDRAIVVNTARGTLVDDEALQAALKSGKLAAAGLDVFEGEPNIHPGYRSLENVFILPHLGSATLETRNAMGFKCCDNLDAIFAGREPPDRVV